MGVGGTSGGLVARREALLAAGRAGASEKHVGGLGEAEERVHRRYPSGETQQEQQQQQQQGLEEFNMKGKRSGYWGGENMLGREMEIRKRAYMTTVWFCGKCSPRRDYSFLVYCVLEVRREHVTTGENELSFTPYPLGYLSAVTHCLNC